MRGQIQNRNAIYAEQQTLTSLLQSESRRMACACYSALADIHVIVPSVYANVAFEILWS